MVVQVMISVDVFLIKLGWLQIFSKKNIKYKQINTHIWTSFPSWDWYVGVFSNSSNIFNKIITE